MMNTPLGLLYAFMHKLDSLLHQLDLLAIGFFLFQQKFILLAYSHVTDLIYLDILPRIFSWRYFCKKKDILTVVS